MLHKRRISKESSSTGVLLNTESRFLKYRVFRTIQLLLLAALSLAFILPIFWMLLSAFKDTKEFFQIPPTLFPENINLNKIAEIWKRGNLLQSYLSTAKIVLGKVVVGLIFCGLGGYVLSRLKPKGATVVLAVTLWSMMMPNNLGLVPLYINIVNASMLDSYVPLWIMAGANAYNTMLFKSFFDGIPKSYLEAARLDGAGELTIFSRIILPLSKPVFMTVSIFTVSNSWGEFLWPYLLLGEKSMQPLGVRTYIMSGDFAADEYLMLLCFVIIPPVIFFLLFQKYIMKGIALGGLKG